MGVQGSAAHRAGTDPLGGVLRELGRQGRRAAAYRPRPVPGPQGVEGPRGPRGHPGPPGLAQAAAIVVTGVDGRARWTPDTPLDGRPVVSAIVAVTPGLETGPLWVVVEESGVQAVTVRVWGPAGVAGAGVEVHLVVYTAAPRD
ncbi:MULTISPECIES: hypothetical protein [unclassified Streptomyces]|uniref:hypothetical protein n=1 Tax=unclassified Streptomyces TaxID=2593676 RepID=UPI00225B5E94|nr:MULTISPECIES: hypothetical protein [unclassified Streptomyces]MCX4550619.1 hypothetical protein [Streptomyces sp. NBC_01500]WSC22064.1 hypothetical protein OIE60_21550 [Streptomyces sp. NBC_01766]